MGSAHSEHISRASSAAAGVTGPDALVDPPGDSRGDPSPTSDRYRFDISVPDFFPTVGAAVSGVSALVDAGTNFTRLRFRPAPKGFWRRQSRASSLESSRL